MPSSSKTSSTKATKKGKDADNAATKHALASLIAEAFQLNDNDQMPDATSGSTDDALLFEVQQVVESAGSVDEGVGQLTRLHNRRTGNTPMPQGAEDDCDRVLESARKDSIRSTLHSNMTDDDHAALDPKFRNARGAAIDLFDDDRQGVAVPSSGAVVGKFEDGTLYSLNVDDLDEEVLDELLLGDEHLVASGLVAPSTSSTTNTRGESRAVALLMGQSDTGSPSRYEGRLLPQRSPMKPTPPRGAATDDSHKKQTLQIRRVNGKFLWRCEVCHEENELADVVHAVRRRKKGAPAGGSGLLPLEEGDEYLLKCRVCECRPSTY